MIMFFKLFTVTFCCLLACSVPARACEDPVLEDDLLQERVEDWQEMRFGMFIHWGPVSLKGTEIGWSRGNQVPRDEYDSLYKRFDPARFDADEWVGIAKQAGMKYMVITSKHHDGFCLWDTKQTDYNIMNSPFGRDVIKELSDACRKGGIAFGTYYSVLDWYHPDYGTGSPGGKTKKPDPDMDRYQEFLHNQLAELVNGYGPLFTIWFDGHWEEPWTFERGVELLKFCRELDPGMLINNRVGKAGKAEAGKTARKSKNPGEYDTPEQRIGAFNNKRPWETCMTICRQWAWKPEDSMKTFEQCIRTLVLTAGGDGNLLFNVGPMSDGRIEPRQADRLKEMGQWLGRHGRSIYGTRGGPFYPGNWGCSTHKGSTVFVHVFERDADAVLLPGISNRILSASLMTGGEVGFEQADDMITLTLPVNERDPVDTIVVLELDAPVTGMAAAARAPTVFDTGVCGGWISKDAAYEMSSRAAQWSVNEEHLLKGEGYSGDYAFHTEQEQNPHIIIDLGRAARVRGLEIVNRMGSLQDRAESLAAWVSKDAKEWTRVWQADSMRKVWSVVLGSAESSMESRYIKIGLNQKKAEYLHLYSVKVYGEL